MSTSSLTCHIAYVNDYFERDVTLSPQTKHAVHKQAREFLECMQKCNNWYPFQLKKKTIQM